jgi:RNA polymerase sigma-70 factor (ECF subfamily)
MSEPGEAFDQFLERARRGDAEAIARFVQEYEAEVRIIARVRLGPALRPYLDSMDVVQSVHRASIEGLKQGKFELSSPQQLRKLAAAIARHKVANQWRRHQKQKRLEGAELPSGAVAPLLASLCCPQSDPAQATSEGDAIQQLLDSLSPADRRLVELRLQGGSTANIARELGVTPDSLRMRLKRLRERLRQQGLYANWLGQG